MSLFVLLPRHGEGAHPVHVTPKGRPRPNACRSQTKTPRPIADLTHRIAGCEGIWGKTKINKFGHQIVFCWRCKATRIAKEGGGMRCTEMDKAADRRGTLRVAAAKHGGNRMSVLDDNMRQRWDRMHAKMAQDVTRTHSRPDRQD